MESFHWPSGAIIITIIIFILSYICDQSESFNFDTGNPIFKRGPRLNSFFGFSVAQHVIKEDDNEKISHVVLVGAPRDNRTTTTTLDSLLEPGALYKCPFTSLTDDCELIPIDLDDPESSTFADKSNQWFGGSVSSQNTIGGYAMVCAPRYKKVGDAYVWCQGVCLLLNNDLTEKDSYEPCHSKSTSKGHHEYGFCQAGISCSLSQDGKVIIGAVGSLNWMGSVYLNEIGSETYWKESVNRRDPTFNLPSSFYSYIGMSVKVGNLIKGRPTYVAGAPRSNSSGQVLLFEQQQEEEDSGGRMTNEGFLKIHPDRYLTGPQFGSGFGYELAIIDLNTDGLEDLIVGAPFEHGKNFGGAIYVYLNDMNGISRHTIPIRLTGKVMTDTECLQLDCHNSRFGYSLASIGDIDRDGYDDLAVGAPYEGRGAVYIYRGSIGGIESEYSQRILASELWSSSENSSSSMRGGRGNLNSFGIAISGGRDMDGNSYPDMVVGSFNSDVVTILRTKPVVYITATFTSRETTISPTLSPCTIENSKDACFKIVFCYRYEVKHRPKEIENFDMTYKIEEDSLNEAVPNLGRVYFKGQGSSSKIPIIERNLNTQLERRVRGHCIDHVVFISRSIRDFLNPIKFRLTYRSSPKPMPKLVAGKKIFDLNDYPVFDEDNVVLPLHVNFAKNCLKLSECISNNELTANLKGSQGILEKNDRGEAIIRVGQDTELQLEISVTNSEEEAHETMLYISLPEKLSYKGTNEKGKMYSCLPNLNQIACSIGNPLVKHMDARFLIRLDPNSLNTSMENLNITLMVNSTSRELNIVDDTVVIFLKIIIETDLQVRGQSIPSEVYFGGSVYGEMAIRVEEQIGTEVIHSYEVKNLGGGFVESCMLQVSWPYEQNIERNNFGKHLLYLMEEPQFDKEENRVKCSMRDKNQVINSLKIITKKSRKQRDEETNREKIDSVNEHVSSYFRRFRRSSLASDEFRMEGNSKVVNLDCDRQTAKCLIFNCDISNLKKGESVVIRFRSRLWNYTFIEDYSDADRVRIVSRARLFVDPSLNIHQMNTKNDISKIVTLVLADNSLHKYQGVEFWVILLAVCLGVLFLLLLIFGLWKCGFFKRFKPEEMLQYQAKLENQIIN